MCGHARIQWSGWHRMLNPVVLPCLPAPTLQGPTSLGRRSTAAPPREGAGGGGIPALFDLISPRGAGATAPNRRGAMGRYTSHTIAPGGSEVWGGWQCVSVGPAVKVATALVMAAGRLSCTHVWLCLAGRVAVSHSSSTVLKHPPQSSDAALFP
jgi:hypothetical protein